ncbi:MAG: hypothetical protein AAFX50_15205 [Acidobacteriota bacterium]
MQTLTELAMRHADHAIFTRRQVAQWVDDDGNRLDALLKRSMAHREIERVARGLYALSSWRSRRPITPMAWAQTIYGPSYVSTESALAYHGWIPEAVYTITNVCSRRSRRVETPFGLFSYSRVPQQLFFAGVRRVTDDEGPDWSIATPIKALADLVYERRFDGPPQDLAASLRVDFEELAGISAAGLGEIRGNYRSRRVQRFLDSLGVWLRLDGGDTPRDS